jgi:hypothetical protein
MVSALLGKSMKYESLYDVLHEQNKSKIIRVANVCGFLKDLESSAGIVKFFKTR